MAKQKIISWVRWHNPYKLLDKTKDSSHDDDDGYDNGVQLDILDDDEEEKELSQSSNLVFFTPLGPVPLTEHNDPSKTFNFWVGHTNFNVSEPIRKIINKIDGVEILNVYTRYRFRIGVGKMFTPRDVTRDINRKISEYFRSKEQENEEQNTSVGTSDDCTRSGD